MGPRVYFDSPPVGVAPVTRKGIMDEQKGFYDLRDRMVATQIIARGITDPRVLAAMGEVPREEFVPAELVMSAYEDAPLPIGKGQTISQPYIVALMTEALELSGEDRVLDVGTGSGYAAAVLSRIVSEVYTVERIENLAREAEKRFQRLGYDNIHVLIGNGTLGWPLYAPYGAIVVAAGGPSIPPSLVSQLGIGGRMVIPIGPTPRHQTLVRIRRVNETDITREELEEVSFVPLVGEGGWDNDL
jgi:protein-L-isoaspartate(D-aspartate) O-methyltransferase